MTAALEDFIKITKKTQCIFFVFYNNIYKWQKITSKKANLRKQNNTISKT